MRNRATVCPASQRPSSVPPEHLVIFYVIHCIRAVDTWEMQTFTQKHYESTKEIGFNHYSLRIMQHLLIAKSYEAFLLGTACVWFVFAVSNSVKSPEKRNYVFSTWSAATFLCQLRSIELQIMARVLLHHSWEFCKYHRLITWWLTWFE